MNLKLIFMNSILMQGKCAIQSHMNVSVVRKNVFSFPKRKNFLFRWVKQKATRKQNDLNNLRSISEKINSTETLGFVMNQKVVYFCHAL